MIKEMRGEDFKLPVQCIHLARIKMKRQTAYRQTCKAFGYVQHPLVVRSEVLRRVDIEET